MGEIRGQWLEVRNRSAASDQVWKAGVNKNTGKKFKKFCLVSLGSPITATGGRGVKRKISLVLEIMVGRLFPGESEKRSHSAEAGLPDLSWASANVLRAIHT
jgi:hypothetical protein